MGLSALRAPTVGPSVDDSPLADLIVSSIDPEEVTYAGNFQKLKLMQAEMQEMYTVLSSFDIPEGKFLNDLKVTRVRFGVPW